MEAYTTMRFYRFISYLKESLDHIDKLSHMVRHQYLMKKIDIRAYERQINYLSVIRLQLEEIKALADELLGYR